MINLGMFYIYTACGRYYPKDDTHQWMICLSIPNADSKEIITVGKIRGKAEDAEKYADELFAGFIDFSKDVDVIGKQLIGRELTKNESVEVKELIQKLFNNNLHTYIKMAINTMGLSIKSNV